MLKFKDGKRFKIGITVSLEQRIRALGVANFDLDSSIAYSGQSTSIKMIERQMLLDYSPAQTECSDLTSGNTEVLNISCFANIEEDIDRKLNLFPQHKLKKGLTPDLN